MTILQDSATRVLNALRRDLESASDVERPILHSVRFLLELVVMLGLGIRGLAYVMTAGVLENVRTEGEFDGFTPEDDPVLRWSYIGPGFEHAKQSRLEIRLAGFATLVAGWVLYKTLIVFRLDTIELAFVYANFGVLFLEPAWTEVYLGYKGSDSGTGG